MGNKSQPIPVYNDSNCNKCWDAGYLMGNVREMFGFTAWLQEEVPAEELPWCDCAAATEVRLEYTRQLARIRHLNSKARIERVWAEAKVPRRFLSLELELPPEFMKHKERAYAACRMFVAKGYVIPVELDSYIAGTSPKVAEKFVHADRCFRSLLLQGPVGVGKTAAMSVVFTTLVEKGIPGLWVEYHQFCSAVQNGYSKGDSGDRIEAAQNATLLLIDDIGSEQRSNGRETDDKNRLLWLIIEHRHREDLPTLMTTNLDERGLRTQFDNRTIDRMYEMAYPVLVNGQNLRKVEV